MSAAGFFFFIAVAALLPSSRHRRRLTAMASLPLSRCRRLAAIAAVNVASHQLLIFLLGDSRLPVGRSPPPGVMGKYRITALSYCCRRLRG